MVSIKPLLIRNSKTYVQNSAKKSYILFTFFLNLHNLINIDHRLLNFLVVTLDIIMEGTVSQIFSLGPRSNFM